MKINPYLTFNGKCREAMTFYQACFGGELSFQTVGESPMADKIPDNVQQNILHSTLTKGDFILMASDMVSDEGLINGNAISLMLDCSSEAEIRTLYAQLSADGEETHPLENTFWGGIFGNLIDKYSNHWLLHFDKNL